LETDSTRDPEAHREEAVEDSE